MAQSLSTIPKSLAVLLQLMKENPSKSAPVLSVLLHGVFFAVLPFINLPELAEEDLDFQREVDVVELTPGELSRVPDFSGSLQELPPISTAEDFDIEDFELEDDYTPPLDPPPPVRFPPITTFEWPSLPTQPPATTPIQPIIPTPPPTQPLEEDTTTPPLTEDETGETSDTSDTDDPPEDATPTETPEQRNERLVAERLAEQQELQRLFTPLDVEQNAEPFSPWYAALRSAGIVSTDSRIDAIPAEVVVPYPSAACSFIQQGLLEAENVNTIVGFAVGPNNQVLDQPEPMFIIQSGIPYFDEQAMAIIKNPDQDWGNTTDKAQPRSLSITFEYTDETCPNGLSAPPEEDA
ncbi:MAG: hypothetical protein VKL39_01610 [Leptolyngbyaceae bacterium]|nr:hypothetical protein [Leptolyngbyaceae bacterium]